MFKKLVLTVLAAHVQGRPATMDSGLLMTLELRRITLAALARYEASGLQEPGDALLDEIRDRVLGIGQKARRLGKT